MRHFTDALFENLLNDTALHSYTQKPYSCIAYHGSATKFNSFNLRHFGKTDDGMFGKGIYFTNNKSIANCFGENNYLYKCRITINNPYVIDNTGTVNGDSSPDAEQYYNMTNKDNSILEARGYDGIISKNEEWTGTNTIIADQYIVFDPSQIEILEIIENK